MCPDALKRENRVFPTETRWKLAVLFAIFVAKVSPLSIRLKSIGPVFEMIRYSPIVSPGARPSPSIEPLM